MHYNNNYLLKYKHSNPSHITQMLKHEQLRHPLKVITILTSLALLLEIGALACQVYWRIMGINNKQYVYLTASDAITTILNNNVLFQLVAFICAIVAILCLLVMLVIVVVGLCRWRNDSSLSYVQNPGNNQVNKTNAQLNPQLVPVPTSALAPQTAINPIDYTPNDYFVYPKIMAACVLYLVAWVCILGNMGLNITLFVCFILGYGSSLLSYAIVGGLSLVSFVFTLVCFIFWQKLRCLINSTTIQSSPAAQGKPNQPLMQTEQGLHTEQNQLQNLNKANNNNNNGNNNLGNNMNNNPNTMNTAGKQSQPPAQGNGFLYIPNNQNNNPDYATFNGDKQNPNPMEQEIVMKNSKDNNNVKNSMNSSDNSQEKKATPKFIQDQSDSSYNMAKKYDSRSNKDNKDNKDKRKDGAQTQSLEKGPANRQSNNIIARTDTDDQLNDRGKGGISRKQTDKEHNNLTLENNLKNSRDDAIRSNEGKPYFKSPQKPKQPQPSYYKSPLDKYTDAPKQTIAPKPVQQPDLTPAPPKLKTSVEGTSGEEEMHSNEFKNSFNKPNMSRFESSGDVQNSSPRGRVRTDTARKAQMVQTNEQKMKKQKKSGMLIDYIRSKYAD